MNTPRTVNRDALNWMKESGQALVVDTPNGSATIRYNAIANEYSATLHGQPRSIISLWGYAAQPLIGRSA